MSLKAGCSAFQCRL